MFADRLAHGLALLGIFGGEPQRAFGEAHPACGDIDPAELQASRRLEEALALDAADQLVGGHAIIVEHQFGRVDAFIAQLVEFLAGGEAFPLVGDEQAHAFVARTGIGVGLDQQGKAAAVERVGNPGLGAVDHIVIAVPPGDRADRLEVGPGIGLGQREPAANFAAGEFGQPFRFLLRRAEALDRGGHDKVRIEDAGRCHPVGRDHHDDLGIG